LIVFSILETAEINDFVNTSIRMACIRKDTGFKWIPARDINKLKNEARVFKATIKQDIYKWLTLINS